MTCEEYREALHQKLDQRDVGGLTPEFRAHANGCEECAKYTAAILHIDRGLASIQRAPLPAGLTESLRMIAPGTSERQPALGWRPFVIKGLAYTVPAVVIWGVAAFTPALVRASINMALTCGGVLIFLLRALRPAIVGERKI